MKGRSLLGASVHRAARLTAASAVIAAPALSGCLDRPVAPLAPLTSTTEVDVFEQSAVDKIDLLLMIDNSASMADKQDILAAAVPNLVNGILNPRCIDDTTGKPVAAASQPSSPTVACPAGSQRDFPPVTDIHVGIITSSLGTFGAGGCPDPGASECAGNNDLGHLITRTDPCVSGAGSVPTYQGEGFLAWDPDKKLSPPGETSLPDFSAHLTDLVTGTGQDGCGWEQQNEAWYHFLVDPSPLDLSQTQNVVLLNTKTGQQDQPDLQDLTNNAVASNHIVDSALVTQRGQFLRPDSLLAIIVLTDETDVSIKESSYFPVLATDGYLPHARTECTTKGPADPCCASCGVPVPDGCAVDPACAASPQYGPTDESPGHGIRAFGLSNGLQSLKARYGVDFLYPTSRYVAALTQKTLTGDDGASFANPLFAQRDPSLVYYATITGVPWQLIARQTAGGTPDLLAGVDPTTKAATGGFKTPAELALTDAKGNTFWDDIAGDPDHYVPPLSPFMQESTAPRSGTDPITGISISPASAANGANPLNGHEWNIGTATAPADNIQYACIFPILKPKDCFSGGYGCDCSGNDAAENNPLCDADPAHGDAMTLQTRAKAYPGVRNLAIVKGMYDANPDSGGIVASICAKQLDDPTSADYGYLPAVSAIIDRLKAKLNNQCLASPLHPDAAGQVQCLVLEASPRPSGGQCSCAGTARKDIEDENPDAVAAAKQSDPTTADDCFCQITQTQGAELQACQTEIQATSTDGWCYVDALATPAIGNPAIVAACPSTERREVRFVGAGHPAPNARTFITCQDD